MRYELFSGGVRPSERLRTLQANVIGLAYAAAVIFGDDYSRLLRELRSAFPALG